MCRVFAATACVEKGCQSVGTSEDLTGRALLPWARLLSGWRLQGHWTAGLAGSTRSPLLTAQDRPWRRRQLTHLVAQLIRVCVPGHEPAQNLGISTRTASFWRQ